MENIFEISTKTSSLKQTVHLTFCLIFKMLFIWKKAQGRVRHSRRILRLSVKCMCRPTRSQRGHSTPFTPRWLSLQGLWGWTAFDFTLEPPSDFPPFPLKELLKWLANACLSPSFLWAMRPKNDYNRPGCDGVPRLFSFKWQLTLPSARRPQLRNSIYGMSRL